MFAEFTPDGFTSPIAGIEMKTLVYGEKTLLARFHLKKGSELPSHTHPHEQTGCLISGRIRLHINGRAFEAWPGDSWAIPGDVEHRAEILEDSVAIEVFSPVRKEFLPADQGV
ncbi:MAG: cupin domain-containing protein [Desulfotignum sp.]|nr:cupin domain-containing protein [Desulfotignum sp.]MCF8112324.1 cupin domain-containing protein [Desulfotignum sp.]MCF8125876.1 cupin domain-containing protein [Desulfotignum sp.]